MSVTGKLIIYLDKTIDSTSKEYTSASPLWDSSLEFDQEGQPKAGPIKAVIKLSLDRLPDVSMATYLIFSHQQYCACEYLFDAVIDLYVFILQILTCQMEDRSSFYSNKAQRSTLYTAAHHQILLFVV